MVFWNNDLLPYFWKPDEVIRSWNIEMVTYDEYGAKNKNKLRLVYYTEVLPCYRWGVRCVFVCVTLTGIGHLPQEVKFQSSVLRFWSMELGLFSLCLLKKVGPKVACILTAEDQGT